MPYTTTPKYVDTSLEKVALNQFTIDLTDTLLNPYTETDTQAALVHQQEGEEQFR